MTTTITAPSPYPYFAPTLDLIAATTKALNGLPADQEHYVLAQLLDADDRVVGEWSAEHGVTDQSYSHTYGTTAPEPLGVTPAPRADLPAPAIPAPPADATADDLAAHREATLETLLRFVEFRGTPVATVLAIIGDLYDTGALLATLPTPTDDEDDPDDEFDWRHATLDEVAAGFPVGTTVRVASHAEYTHGGEHFYAGTVQHVTGPPVRQAGEVFVAVGDHVVRPQYLTVVTTSPAADA